MEMTDTPKPETDAADTLHAIAMLTGMTSLTAGTAITFTPSIAAIVFGVLLLGSVLYARRQPLSATTTERIDR